ncbi:SDR family oxidoreductase [Phytomonospora endophytica]|uniref:NAD(P)-dependent dehydrogenase (Short-subunit alcohol dehydrogenase family) n=1 Tax=Phytomonospora endophytica TaxID=714109 RepID=A0A841FAH7_9ACTN|nr:SDR family oxidoreductase [Phytomonospora endophytica]MBB6034261.1 NAD(P)-dependent dehydrogenase (short-subunit alcohol dehydrogenase family) [Phytomonospora endophytica]GIG66653.1 short-chain dehydrogenase [Phytomonospora endophytica]
MSTLIGKTALVTGASRGIGRAIAARLAAEGALVAVHYGSNKAAADETVAAIQAAGGRAFAVGADFGTEGDIDALLTGLDAGLGGTGLDILVNNAALAGGTDLENSTPDYFDRMFAVNVKAPFFLIQRLLPNMRDGGRVINVSSGVTRIALPETVYAMTKGAVETMSRNLANSYATGKRGITVNTVAPGPVDTGHPMFQIPEVVEGTAKATALDRMGEPEDIAAAVAFLASDDARWITGNTVDATGGMFLGPRF